jgi:hypothetical protein
VQPVPDVPEPFRVQIIDSRCEGVDRVMHVENVFRALIAIASPMDKYFLCEETDRITPVSFANGKPLATDRATLQGAAKRTSM